jgi:hypothetical protein
MLTEIYEDPLVRPQKPSPRMLEYIHILLADITY